MYKKFTFLFICFLITQLVFSNSITPNPNPKKITIYWDTSLSMKDRDIVKEIEFLDNYFNNVTDVQVELISFSNTIDVNNIFKIVNSDWTSLKEVLLNTKYDGVAYFDILLEDSGSDINLLFTDGLEIIDKLNINTNTPTFIINSCKKSNDDLLKEQSFNSNGNYINLNEISVKEGLSLLQNDKIDSDKSNNNFSVVSGTVFSSGGVLTGVTITVKGKTDSAITNKNGNFNIKATSGDILIVSYLGKYIEKIVVDKSNAFDILLIGNDKAIVTGYTKVEEKIVDLGNTTNDNFNEVSGAVFSSEGILVGATVTVKGKTYGTVTDDNGNFSIKATRGDVLIVSYLGKYIKKITVEESDTYDILLISSKNELDEVIVKGETKVEEEIVDLGNGKVDKRKLGYAVQTISSKDLAEGRSDNISVHGKFSGVTKYGQNDDISQMVFRANSLLLNIYPLVVINGTPLTRSISASPYGKGSAAAGGRDVNLTNFINPDDIATITILKGLAATNRWGSEGSNGVILITTKTGSYASLKDSKPYDKALLRDNNYNENLTLVNTSVNEKYIEELKKYKTLNELYDFYLEQRNSYLNDFQYLANVSDYVNQSGNKILSSKILSNILENNPNDVEALRFVAYKAEQNHDFFFAKSIYEKIAKLKPNEPQSYRDLALIYQETGFYQEALDIYNKIENNKYTNVNFSGLKKNIDNEMRRLILLHRKELDLRGVSDRYLNTKSLDYDARIVFDWNKRNADFELQFVNPQKKFFTWSHTKTENISRLDQEISQGFNSEEFLLIAAEKGEWLINIESKIKNNKKPVTIKYTVYQNFGKPNETVEIRVLILNNIKEKQTIGKITI